MPWHPLRRRLLLGPVFQSLEATNGCRLLLVASPITAAGLEMDLQQHEMHAIREPDRNAGSSPSRHRVTRAWRLLVKVLPCTAAAGLAGHSRDIKPTTLMRSTSTLSLGANAHNAGSETRQPGRLESPSPAVGWRVVLAHSCTPLPGDEGGPGQDMAPWWPW